MTVYPHPARRQAHVHLPQAQRLTKATLIDAEGRNLPVVLHAHDTTHYMLSWKQPLSEGYYGLYFLTQEGQRFHYALRIG